MRIRAMVAAVIAAALATSIASGAQVLYHGPKPATFYHTSGPLRPGTLYHTIPLIWYHT